MKRIPLILVFFFVAMFANQMTKAQNVDFVWVKQAGSADVTPCGDNPNRGDDVAIDSSGNILIVGRFGGTTNFDGTEVTAQGNSPCGPLDIFVAKYDDQGNLLWIRHTGGTEKGGSHGWGVTTDGQDNVIITGHYSGTIAFGSVTLPAGRSYDFYLAKYDPDGNLLWAKYALGNEQDQGFAVSTDDLNNILVTGNFAHHNYGGYITFENTTLTTYGGRDLFLAKYDPDGNLLWTRHDGSPTTGTYGADKGEAIVVDQYGNSLVTGFFAGTATFDSQTIVSLGGLEIFIAKYDPDGNVIWTKRAGGAGRDEARGIALDEDGSIFVTGWFQDTADFGGASLTAHGVMDVFVAKYDTSGDLIWVTQAGDSEAGTGQIRGRGIALDEDGNILIAGTYVGDSSFDGIPLPGDDNEKDIFTAKLDSVGNFLWAVSADGNDPDLGVGSDPGQDIAVDKSGNGIVTGSFLGTSNFGSITLTSIGRRDIFLAALGPIMQNEPPVSDTGGPYLGAVNEPITFDGSGSSDPDDDPLSYAWDFGNGNTGTGEMSSYSYAAADIYDVCLTVNDGLVDSDPACTLAVVYDPDGGFVTGGGWIYSESGWCALDAVCAGAEGKANFGFVSKYKRGASVPVGNTEFNFKAGDLNFHSSSYDWLVVAGKDKVKYKGVGTINGEGNFGFMLTATDGRPDTFRIKIWDKNAGDVVVYDNKMGESDDGSAGTVLGGGNIVVHTGKK